jgi:hypothetical protein
MSGRFFDDPAQTRSYLTALFMVVKEVYDPFYRDVGSKLRGRRSDMVCRESPSELTPESHLKLARLRVYATSRPELLLFLHCLLHTNSKKAPFHVERVQLANDSLDVSLHLRVYCCFQQNFFNIHPILRQAAGIFEL